MRTPNKGQLITHVSVPTDRQTSISRMGESDEMILGTRRLARKVIGVTSTNLILVFGTETRDQLMANRPFIHKYFVSLFEARLESISFRGKGSKNASHLHTPHVASCVDHITDFEAVELAGSADGVCAHVIESEPITRLQGTG